MGRWLENSEFIIIEKARALLEEVSVEDLALLVLPREAVHKTPRSSVKMKDGMTWGIPRRSSGHSAGPPPEYGAVETYLDLKAELEKRRPNPDLVLSGYLHLLAYVTR